jgi:Tfp pilus assembly protein PilW
MKSRKSNRRRGATLIEALTASGLSILALFTAVSVMISGMGSWAKGQGRIDAEGDAQAAIRAISNELREAMAVTVVSGTVIEYRLPRKDEAGNFIVPAEWDGVARRIEWIATGSGIGNIRVTGGTTNRTLCRNVILRDPQSSGFTPTSGGSSYAIFTAGAGAITRQLTIMIATRANGSRNQYVVSRSRETVFLRNIPSLTR